MTFGQTPLPQRLEILACLIIVVISTRYVRDSKFLEQQIIEIRDL
jgi:hypothetical protein